MPAFYSVPEGDQGQLSVLPWALLGLDDQSTVHRETSTRVVLLLEVTSHNF